MQLRLSCIGSTWEGDGVLVDRRPESGFAAEEKALKWGKSSSDAAFLDASESRPEIGTEFFSWVRSRLDLG